MLAVHDGAPPHLNTSWRNNVADLEHRRCSIQLPSADEERYVFDVLGIGQGMVRAMSDCAMSCDAMMPCKHHAAPGLRAHGHLLLQLLTNRQPHYLLKLTIAPPWSPPQVDFAASVDDDVIEACIVPKGGRRVISVEERAHVIEQLSGLPSRLSAGGSLANTLVGLARLGAAQTGSSSSSISKQGLRVAMGGAIGGDALGKYFAAQLNAAGVQCVGTPAPGSQTGTVMVLSTPDAQRSFLSYFSNDGLTISPELQAAVQRSRLVVIEGYLFELPGAATALPALVRTAKQAGAAVAVTAGDAGVVVRHRQAMLDTIHAGADLLFTNAAEAAELVLGAPGDTGSSSSTTTTTTSQDIAGVLGRQCAGTVAVVTDGSRGSYISTGGRVQVTVPPAWSAAPPVDTCGAGDAYAAGLLFGLLQGFSLPAMGLAAARTASAVIKRLSPHLHEQDAEHVVAGLALKPAVKLLSRDLQSFLAANSSSALAARTLMVRKAPSSTASSRA